MMENLAPIDPSELPDGFSAVNPQGGPAAAGGEGQSQKQLAMEEQKKAILEQALSQEALARLGRIRLVKKDKAVAVENQIVSLAMQGKLPGKINEPKLIEILERGGLMGGASPEKISIQRKQYAMDSDDSDDNDDDLM